MRHRNVHTHSIWLHSLCARVFVCDVRVRVWFRHSRSRPDKNRIKYLAVEWDEMANEIDTMIILHNVMSLMNSNENVRRIFCASINWPFSSFFFRFERKPKTKTSKNPHSSRAQKEKKKKNTRAETISIVDWKVRRRRWRTNNTNKSMRCNKQWNNRK